LKREYVRLGVGVLVILCHFAAFAGIILWQQQFIPAANERIDSALLLVPVTAGYLLAVVRSAIQRKDLFDSEGRVNLNYVIVVALVTVAFCISLLYTVFAYPAVFGPTTVELKRWLVVLEIGFGGGFGLIAEDLFGKVERIVVPPPGS
jgi:uncharacterized Tic20 family protein